MDVSGPIPWCGHKKYSCKYPGCNNWYYANIKGEYVNKHFFTFPSKQEYQDLWKNACKIDKSINCTHWKICEDHFPVHHFVNMNKNKLNKNAVPIEFKLINICTAENLVSSESDSVVERSDLNIQENTPFCKCFDVPSTSKSIITCSCSCTNFVNSQNDEIVSLKDHDYIKVLTGTQDNRDKYDFLNDSKSGILSKIGIPKIDLSPTKQAMYKIHRNVTSKLSKLRNVLQNEKEKRKAIEKLYNTNKFQFIDESLNCVTKEFINSQLRNVNKKPSARRWSEQDKAFSLSVYKRSPRLYRYLQTYFQLPSTRTLKDILSKIPFDAGINKAILEHLRNQAGKMKSSDRFCSLLFDEISLSQGLHYEHHKQMISGFEDLGSLGRSNKTANHALVFMVRGIRKQWKQVVAYYFTAHTISSLHLKTLLKEIIINLQEVGLNVVATICDQGTTNQSALTYLCSENHPRKSPYYFFVNNKPIVTIFDVPHLLKNTRNALLKCKIEFEANKFAKFQYIEAAFNLDQIKTFKSLPKLKKEHFNFADSYMKMKVKVAAAQLSSSMAAAIETFSVFSTNLPSEALFTAEFVNKIDNLFDSLNGWTVKSPDLKIYHCALTQTSPHLEFWTKMLKELSQWKLISLETNTDWTNKYSFVKGWQKTIKSVIFLWNSLKNLEDFQFLSLRGLNQDPIENLFCNIRQHGIANTNPTCHQFTAALKTVVINKLALPSKNEGNCENDNCTP